MNPSARRNVFLGGFLAGLADFIYPTVKALMAGNPWFKPWKGVASGLLGQAARDGGVEMALLGALLHFFICISAAFILYFVVKNVKFLPRHWVPLAIIHGLAVLGGDELRHRAALADRHRALPAEDSSHLRVLAHRPRGHPDGLLCLARATDCALNGTSRRRPIAPVPKLE
jgi:hypothetical protein